MTINVSAAEQQLIDKCRKIAYRCNTEQQFQEECDKENIAARITYYIAGEHKYFLGAVYSDEGHTLPI